MLILYFCGKPLYNKPLCLLCVAVSRISNNQPYIEMNVFVTDTRYKTNKPLLTHCVGGCTKSSCKCLLSYLLCTSNLYTISYFCRNAKIKKLK